MNLLENVLEMSSGRATRTQERGVKFAQLKGRIPVLPLALVGDSSAADNVRQGDTAVSDLLSAQASFVSTAHV